MGTMKMKIRFQLFAGLRDAANASHLEMEVQAGTTVDDAVDLLIARNAGLHDWRGRIAFARDDQIVNGRFVIDQPMQIDLLPPVSGG
jgi:molybdopterin converting factor small subunit